MRAQLDLAIQLSRMEVLYKAQLVRDYSEVALVEANASRLGQVFLNLLINAAQAIPEGTPAGNEIRVVARMEAAEVLVEVHDTGGGISAEARDHLFEPFFTTKEVGVGSGLGPYICHNFVTALGGTIAAERGTERGSVFRVRIPAGPTAEPPPTNALVRDGSPHA